MRAGVQTSGSTEVPKGTGNGGPPPGISTGLSKELTEDLTKMGKEPVFWLEVLIGVGLFGVFLYSLQPGTGLAVFGAGFTIALASLLVGGLLGFLFGIPRYLQKEQTTEFQENTNLEQISDWLTKILVGVGLVQIAVLWEKIPNITAFLSPALGGLPSSGIFGIAIIVYFSIDGFFIGYLWTRLTMASKLTRQRQELIYGRQYQQDLEALTELENWLHPKGMEQKDPKELVKIFALASDETKNLIFYKIDEDWKLSNYGKTANKRLIPILSALIESRPDSPYWYYYNLGFAYMEQPKPDCTAAEAQFTEAIDRRGLPYEKKDLEYELRRAVCWIRLGKDEKSIRSDLEKAKEYPNLKTFMYYHEIEEWEKAHPPKAP